MKMLEVPLSVTQWDNCGYAFSLGSIHSFKEKYLVSIVTLTATGSAAATFGPRHLPRILDSEFWGRMINRMMLT